MNDLNNLMWFGGLNAVAITSGIFIGKHFEKKKAMLAFRRVAIQCTESTTAIANACVALLRAKFPDTDPEQIANELLAECSKHGLQAVAITRSQAIKAGLINDNNQT